MTNIAYLESIPSIGVISVPWTDTCLMPDKIGDFFEFFTVDVSIAVQIKHAEGDFEMSPRS